MSLVKSVFKILKKRNWYISVMESCTGGAIANSITNIPGSSDIFKEGLVAYSNEAKIKAGVETKIIEKFGVYSFTVAEEMTKNTKGEIGVGVTGQLPGMVYIAVRIKNKVESEKLKVESELENKVKDRIRMKRKVVGKVMRMIWEGIK